MDVTATLAAPDHTPAAVWAVVADLSTYPRWLDIVARAEPAGEAAWSVDLRGRLGPFARSKRLRMVRTASLEPALATFERSELDGRDHSPWVLQAEVADDGGGGSALTMRLHYGGSLFGPVLERLLGDAIVTSRPRLLAVLDGDG